MAWRALAWSDGAARAEPLYAVGIGHRRLLQESRLHQRVAVDDLVGLLGVDRLTRFLRGDLVGHQWVLLAHERDELVEGAIAIAVMQRAFELIAEQRAELLPVADAFEERQRGAHALGSQVDSHLVRVVRDRSA